MDLRKHINDATGNALKHHRVLEGGCYHKGIYYLIFGNMSKKTSKVVKIKNDAAMTVLGVSDTLKIGHANDCCVRGSILYVTHSGSKGVIHRVSTGNLEKLPDIKLKGLECGFNGISCMGKGYILKKMGSRKCYILDEHLKVKKIKKGKKKGKPKTITLSKTYKVGQGMTWSNGRLYRGSSIGQSTNNVVAVYDSKGKLRKVYKYNHKCELEDVFVVGNILKIGIYRKHKVKGKKKFEAYIKKLGEIK